MQHGWAGPPGGGRLTRNRKKERWSVLSSRAAAAQVGVVVLNFSGMHRHAGLVARL